MSLDGARLRGVLGHFPTGVTVVTTLDDQRRPAGLTANAFASVSLVPPLVLVCIDRASDTHDLVARSGKTVSELVSDLYEKVGGHYYDRIDVHMQPDQRQGAIDRVAAAKPDAIAGRTVTKQSDMDGYMFEFEGGWLLVRPSGTEPLLRIYTEVTDQALVKPVLQIGRELAGV